VNSDLLKIVIWVVVVAVTFGVLWRKGYLMRLSNYVLETREELRKCTWPSLDELKGSTVLIMVTIFLLGGFIVAVDYVISLVVGLIT
jgi:preprotein translocase subunit SecE